MAEFEVSAGCIELDASLDDLEIIFPGPIIFRIPTPPGVNVVAAADYAKQIIAGINAALMPLQPIFNIIDLLLALVEFAKAIPDAIVQLDPGKLTAALPKLSAKLDKLLAMIPPVSIPIFIKGVLRVAIVFLVGIRAAIQAVIDALLEAAAARARATFVASISLAASLQIGAAADCAEASANAQLSGIANGAAPLNSLLSIIALFVELVGLPVKIPTLATLAGDATVALVAVDAMISVLGNVQVAIVV